MSEILLLVVGDGEYDVGKESAQTLSNDDLPALPKLVHRLLGEKPYVRFKSCALKHVRTNQRPGQGPDLARKVKAAALRAVQQGAEGMAIVVDRDVNHGDRMNQLREGRDSLDPASWVPCALGMAVETFDAWMIADTHALRRVCESANAHPNPESLAGKPGTEFHPKSFAASQLGGMSGLGKNYATIAGNADLEHLERTCRLGFEPFAREVRQQLLPVVSKGS